MKQEARSSIFFKPIYVQVTFTYYVSSIFEFLTPSPPLVSICQQQGPPRHAGIRFYPLPSPDLEKLKTHCYVLTRHHKSFTNQQPRALHLAGKCQIELVKNTRKKCRNYFCEGCHFYNGVGQEPSDGQKGFQVRRAS